MRKRYRVGRAAEKDLDAIWLYVAMDASEAVADKLVEQLVEKFRHLAQFPLSGRARNDIEYGVRSFPASEFIIYYRPGIRGGVLIARIIHGARRQKQAWMEKL